MTETRNKVEAGDKVPERCLCTVCGCDRVRLTRADDTARWGACTFTECPDPLKDYRAENAPVSAASESPWREIAEKVWLSQAETDPVRGIEKAIAVAVEAQGQLYEEQWVKYPQNLPVLIRQRIAERMAELLERQKATER